MKPEERMKQFEEAMICYVSAKNKETLETVQKNFVELKKTILKEMMELQSPKPPVPQKSKYPLKWIKTKEEWNMYCKMKKMERQQNGIVKQKTESKANKIPLTQQMFGKPFSQFSKEEKYAYWRAVIRIHSPENGVVSKKLFGKKIKDMNKEEKRQYDKVMYKRKNRIDKNKISISERLFGKKHKDLLPEELKEYYRYNYRLAHPK